MGNRRHRLGRGGNGAKAQGASATMGGGASTMGGGASTMSGGAPMQGTTLTEHPNVTVVTSREEFEREAQRLRESGFTEVPGALGGGSGGGISADYADYIEAKLACSEGTGKSKTSLPLLHVSSGYAQPVTAANGHKGSYITWGAGNRIPNVISLLCSLLPYTAAALKFNIDLCCGMGPRPMYAYTQYVGGNISQKSIPYDQADKLILGQIRDLQLQLVKLEQEHPELTESGSDLGVASRSDASQGSDPSNTRAHLSASSAAPLGSDPDRASASDAQSVSDPYSQKSAAAQMRDELREQIESLRKDLATWQLTMKQLYGDPEATESEDRIGFLGRNNLLQTFQQLYADMLQYNICFPEFELQKSYLVPSQQTDPATGKTVMKDVPASQWSPKVVGLKWRNAKTMRLEMMSNQNRIEHVYISNQWISSPEQTLPTQDSDFKIDALPALTYQQPAQDLERLARDARTARTGKEARPTHVVMPVTYNEYGHPYYPVPAWYSVFSGDVYTYASLLISDRKKRRDNANVIGRILYVSDEYVQRMYIQRHLDTPEQRREFFNKEIVEPINNFLKNRDHMGEPMLAYTFKDSDGKTYKSWEIVEVQENNAQQAEANKEELAEISSIILFAWGVDSQLIGNTPGTTTRSGGTDLRERYLLKQVNMALMQQLVLNTLQVVNVRNQWDPHLQWQIKKEVLTTLDNSKTGITEAENS